MRRAGEAAAATHCLTLSLPHPPTSQGNHDYGGLLNSQLNWGKRAPHPGGEPWDVRWKAPSLYFNWSRPMLNAASQPAEGPKACVAFIAIDTPPLVDTYRAAAGSNTGDPERRATTAIRGIFQQQINSAVEMGFGLQSQQIDWLAEKLVEASQRCNAVVVTGHGPICAFGAPMWSLWGRGGCSSSFLRSPPVFLPDSRGQHGQSLRQQDLRIRLNLPEAFAWAGVDAYLNGLLVGASLKAGCMRARNRLLGWGLPYAQAQARLCNPSHARTLSRSLCMS